MTCRCEERVKFIKDAHQGHANQARGKFLERLETFRDGIADGARELAALHLYRAGVYWASRDGELSRNPGPYAVSDALEAHLHDVEGSMPLVLFYQRHEKTVRDQAVVVEAESLLRRFLRKREKAPGLLAANAKSELESAARALEQIERLETRLKAWGQSSVGESNPEAIRIVDVHKDEL